VSLADKTHNASAINADLRAHSPWIAAERFAREVDEMEDLAARS